MTLVIVDGHRTPCPLPLLRVRGSNAAMSSSSFEAYLSIW